MDDKPGQNGDQITVGDIKGSTGVAIGRYAQAIVNYVFPGLEALTAQRERSAMLTMMKKFWVQDVLESSLSNATLIQLNLVEQPDAVDNQGWSTTIQRPAARPVAAAPPSTVVAAFYTLNELTRTLLLLGAPGSGKTTLLLDLARHALELAEQDATQPIPVVFNLASWSLKRQALADWLVDELSDKYYVAKTVSRPWVNKNQLLLLLDGLDEVATEEQNACVAAINAFCEEYKMSIVVCCRVEEYEPLTVHLHFQRAVLLQPLTLAQIEQQLQGAAGAEFAALAAVLQRDAALQEMAQNPLILNTMLRAFHGVSLDQWQALAATDAPRHYLFDAYVKRMFSEHGRPQQRYSQERTLKWLGWLAGEMQQHAQAVFLIERMQPDWLSNRRARWAYVLISRLLLSLIGGLIGGPILGFGFALFFQNMQEGLARGVVEGVLSCLIAGIVVGLIDALRTEENLPVLNFLRTITYWKLALHILIISLSVGVCVWIGLGVVLGSLQWLGFPASFWWKEGVSVGLLLGLCFGLLFGFGSREGRQILSNDIQTVENLNWSPTGALVGGVYGLVGGFMSGLMLAWSTEEILPVPLSAMFQGWHILLVSLPVLTLFGLVAGGLRGGIIQRTNKPNQGIRLSARNAVVAGGSMGVGMAVIAWIVGALTQDHTGALTLSVYGCFFGLLAALWYGGVDVLKHAILRYLLFRSSHAPLAYPRFLDYAAERIFLRKVGGGYIFIHRLLLEYFARLELP